MGTIQFDRIYHGLSPELGKLRVASSGMAWKGAESEGVTAIPAKDIKWAQWIRVARGFQLRLGLKDYSKVKFDGFPREDHDKVANLIKTHFAVTLETREVSFKGWNWGVTDFQGEDLAFTISDRTGFELPLRHVANSNIAGKTEVSLEFSNLSPTPSAGPKSVLTKNMGDELTEIRFYVPGTITKLKGSDADSAKSDKGDADAENDEDEEEISAAQVFHDTIKEKAEIGQVLGDLILSFEEVLVLTPRGRYDMDMFPDFLRLRGKTYDYKVLYQSIAKLFLLPKDDQHVLVILGLSTPIRQGQTLYQYLVMQFSREEEITAELNMSEEDIAKYDRLKKNYEEPTYDVVSSVFRGLAGKKIIGAGSFQSRDGHPGLKANLKAIQGDLFLLERYIFFVSKQPLLVEISDIYQVVFSRVGAGPAGRTFDLKIITKTGPEHNFTSINKEEHEVTEVFLKDKKVKVKNEMMADADLLLAAVGDEDDDDEDMQSVVSDDDERARGKVKPPRPRGPDDDSEEEDDDFQASGSDEGSPSDSDSDSSGAKTASDTSGDDLTEKKGAKIKGKGKAKAKDKDKDKDKDNDKDGEKVKKPAKKKPAVPKGSDAEDGEKPKAKPKPKPKPKEKKTEDGDAMDVDVDGEEKKSKPKPKPKPKVASTSASGAGASASAAGSEVKAKPKPKPKPKVKAGDDAMDVDGDDEKDKAKEKEKPRPKPRPKKKEGDEVEPPKKKLKKDGE